MAAGKYINSRRHETFEKCEYVHFIDASDGFTDVDIC